MELTRLGKSAYLYAKKLGWHVFPAKPNSKEPATTHGFHNATNDLQQICDWWVNTPNFNVAIRTGKESGIVVIDVDGEEGQKSLELLIEQYGDLPETVESKTGSGGRHILFKYPSLENGRIKSRINCFFNESKIDIRADGGYIIAPPSTHPNGNVYEWELSSRPLEVDIAELPKWMMHFLIESNHIAKPKREASHWDGIMQGINEGGRNAAATSLAGYLARHYVDKGLIYDLLFMWNKRNNPPLSTDELETILKSVWTIENKRRNSSQSNNFRW